jgi:hypothetical protein
MTQASTPTWMQDCAGHSFYQRGEVVASLPTPQWKQYEARGWRYLGPDHDAADHHAMRFRVVFGLDRLVTFRGHREVLTTHREIRERVTDPNDRRRQCWRTTQLWDDEAHKFPRWRRRT